MLHPVWYTKIFCSSDDETHELDMSMYGAVKLAGEVLLKSFKK